MDPIADMWIKNDAISSFDQSVRFTAGNRSRRFGLILVRIRYREDVHADKLLFYRNLFSFLFWKYFFSGNEVVSILSYAQTPLPFWLI